MKTAFVEIRYLDNDPERAGERLSVERFEVLAKDNDCIDACDRAIDAFYERDRTLAVFLSAAMLEWDLTPPP